MVAFKPITKPRPFLKLPLLFFLLFPIACSPTLSLHINPATSQLTITDHRTHQSWPQQSLTSTSQQTLLTRTASQFLFDCHLPATQRNGFPTSAHFHLTLKITHDDLDLTFTNQTPNQELLSVDYPYTFLPPFADPQTIYPHAEGMLIPATITDPNYLPIPDTEDPGIYSGLGCYCACIGLTSPSTGQGLLTLFDSPELTGFRFHTFSNLSLPTLHIAADKFHITRPVHFILHFSPTGGYVSLARRYRQYIADSGRHVTLADKHSPVPGSTIFWLHGSLPEISSIAASLPAAGVQRAIINLQNPDIVRGDPPPHLADTIRSISSQGYLVSRYDQYRDCFEPNPHAGGYDQINRDAWPDSVVHSADGSLLSGFGPHSGVISPNLGLALAKSHIPADLAAHPYTARFLDCLGSIGFGEGVDFSPIHPSTVYDARRAREQTLQFARSQKPTGSGPSVPLPLGTECGNDYLLPHLDWVEGPETLVRYANLPVGDGPKPPTKTYSINISPKYRIPFYSLVHHDEVLITFRWEDGLGALPPYDRDKELWCILDGNPPLYFLSPPSWLAQRDSIARREKELGPWLRQVAGRQMLSHEFLTPDHQIQQSTFTNHLTATVNFSDHPHTLPSGTTIPPKSYLLSRP
ncbi:MAG TPA: glycoside hydrolase [Tepidisphaeraceae bacterium]|nr:glycoside hydrolase [Tepidisphaeraceae bacterium]